MAVGVLAAAAVFLFLFFIEPKGKNFAGILLPAMSAGCFWALTSYCDLGIRVGTEVYTYPFLGSLFQGAFWLCIGLTLYNLAQETMGKMRGGDKRDGVTRR